MVKKILVTRQSLLPKGIELNHQEDTDAQDQAFADKDQILVMSRLGLDLSTVLNSDFLCCKVKTLALKALGNFPDFDASNNSSTRDSDCSKNSDCSTDLTDVKKATSAKPKPPFKAQLTLKATHKIST